MRRLAALATTFALLAASCTNCQVTQAGEVIRLSEATWEGAAPEGKEVDCIYGDWVLRNDKIVAVIGEAIRTRHANMSVINVGGSVVDLTQRDQQSDQLSAYYPVGRLYDLEGPLDKDGKVISDAQGFGGKTLSFRFKGPAKQKETPLTAEVLYTLNDGEPWLKIVTRVTNTGKEPLEWKQADAIRADGEFTFGKQDELGLFWAYDPYWRQAYGSLLADSSWHFVTTEVKNRARPELLPQPKKGPAPPLGPGETRETVRYLFPAANTIELIALARELRGQKPATASLSVRDGAGPVDGADVTVSSAANEPIAHGRTGADGKLAMRLIAGAYQLQVSGPGRAEQSVPLEILGDTAKSVELPTPGYVVAAIAGPKSAATACKVQFIGRGKSPDPKFGPDSSVHGVRNAYYSENGKFRTALAPGEYDVIVSHGPEFDAVFTTLTVASGKDSPLKAELVRTVDTRGWLSADFHSHSTPSGDNTSSQRGRVLNLLAEHLEFAPCTEHNRITVYDPHLKHFAATDRMLSCPGMELTGSPLPLNHQNAFPLAPRPRTQDGGGPKTDVDPVVQIERLAMWDGGAEKLVQINHPNIPQMVGDRDLNGSPDGGFEKMFSFVDVIEVHPLNEIFLRPDKLPTEREQGNTIFHWLQLLNLGYRVPGVVNTDAHWNFHGSGWLRNYIQSSTDEPTQAKVGDLVHASEHGNIVMTNGPYLEVSARADQGDDKSAVGEDLKAPDGKLHLKVRVQCPNWLQVNRVQVFVNGKPDPKLNFTRGAQPTKFHAATVVFDEDLAVELPADAHLVVACGGEGEGLGPVMGPDHAKDMPAAVANPIFVDVDGKGFMPNGDMLGLPLPIAPGQKSSKPHGHKHSHNHADAN